MLYERGTNSRTAVVVVQFFRKRSAFGIIIVMSLIINMRLFKSVIFSSKDSDSMEPTSSSMKIQCQFWSVQDLKGKQAQFRERRKRPTTINIE